jgi:hypothetical protein
MNAGYGMEPILGKETMRNRLLGRTSPGMLGHM